MFPLFRSGQASYMPTHFSNENSVPWFSNNNAGVRVLFHGHVCSKKHTFFFLIIFDKAKVSGENGFSSWSLNIQRSLHNNRNAIFMLVTFVLESADWWSCWKPDAYLHPPSQSIDFGILILLRKMFRDEPEFEKKTSIMSVKNDAFKCQLFGSFFKRRTV